MEFFNFLPEEIEIDILSRVPAESLLDCKLVCTTWNNLVRHPLFAKMHMHHLDHPFDDDSCKLGFIASTRNNENVKFWYFQNHGHEPTPIERINLASSFQNTKIVGSCNGLICLYNMGWQPSVYVCNPITRECVFLPQIQADPNLHSYRSIGMGDATIGFGYVASTNEYKVVGIYKFISVHIYTLGSGNGWRNIGKFDHKFDLYEPICTNGALYFMNLKKTETIITFDLAEEKFCENILHPEGNYWWKNRIEDLDGILVFADWLKVEGANYYDIWLLKKKREMKVQEECQPLLWNKEFRVEESKLLNLTNSGGVLTYVENYYKIYTNHLNVPIHMLSDFIRRFSSGVFPHKNTLVSLRELGEEDTKTMESIERDGKL